MSTNCGNITVIDIINDITSQSKANNDLTLDALSKTIENYVTQSNIAFNRLAPDTISYILTSVATNLKPKGRGKLRTPGINIDAHDIMNLSTLFKIKLIIVNPEELSTDTILGDRLKDAYTPDLFMDNYYESAPRSRMYAESLAKKTLVESFLYTIGENGEKNVLLSLEEINKAIQAALNKLLEIIALYLRALDPSILENYISKYNKELAERGGKQELKLTAIAEHLRNPKIDIRGRNGSFHAFLRYYPNEFIQPSNLDLLMDALVVRTDENKLDRMRFMAYNAYVILSNFDNFVYKLFGKLVKIDDTTRQFAKGRYTINNIGSNNYTTWRSTDEIWLDKEINTIGQLIITTTPYYIQGLNVPDLTKFLKFNQFNYVMGKLKRFSIGMRYDKEINTTFETTKTERIKNKTLSQLAQDYINQNNIQNIKLLIWSSRNNPQIAWSVLLEILAGESRENVNSLFGIKDAANGFLNEDLNIIYSLHKELTGPQNTLASQIDLNIGLSLYNYMANLSLIMDSVFKTSYIQYYEDPDTGEIRIRSLADLTTVRIRQDIERKVNNQLSTINYQEFKDTYNIKIIKDDKDNKVKELTLNLDGYTVHYNPVSSELTFEKDNKTIRTYPPDLLTDVYEIESLTGLDISNSGFLSGWNNTQGTNYNSIDQLLINNRTILILALRSAFTAALNNEIFIGENNVLYDSKSLLESAIKSVFSGKDVPGVNEVTRTANVTILTDLLLLQKIALSMAYSAGLITSSQIKAGDGNAISANSLSRLGDGYIHQWYEQNFKDWSASLDFILLNNPAFLGLFQVKELKDIDNEVLASEKMTTADMVTSNFIHDFLGQMQVDSTKLSIVYIIPQVISDKKFIGRLGINLDAKLDLYSILDLDTINTLDLEKIPNTWKELLNHQKYEDIMTAIIQRDFKLFFDKVHNSISQSYSLIKQAALKSNKIFTAALDIRYKELVNDKYGKITDNWFEYLDLFDLAFFETIDKFKNSYVLSIPLDLSARLSQYILDNNLQITIKDLIFNNPKLYSTIKELYERETNSVVIDPHITSFGNNITNLKLFLDLVSKQHNINNPSSPIELIDLVHYVEVKDGNSVKHLVKNPTFSALRTRFSTLENTRKFFKERFLASASNMLDRGFEYSLELGTNKETSTVGVKAEKSEVNRNVHANSTGWITNEGEIVIAKVTYTEYDGKTITVNIRDKSDVRTLIKRLLKNKFRTRGQISYDIWSKLTDESGVPIFTSDELRIIEDAERMKLLITNQEEYKLKGKIAGRLEELYLLRIIKRLTPQLKSDLIAQYKDEHDEKYLHDEDGNPYSDEQILNKVFRAPVYLAISEELEIEKKKELDELDKTLQEVINEANSKYNQLVATNPEEAAMYKVDYEINPNVRKYSMLDYLFSEEWIASTVGHHMAHPNKGLKFGLELTEEFLYWDEALRKDAQNKRNVSVSATMQEFLLGLLSGIPSQYNIAVIDDINDTLYNVTGNVDKRVKPYDGATFVNPLVVWYENASLGGSKAGVIKKLFVHFYNEKTGTGGIVKTAGFGITNMTMRDMPADLSMHKSMNSMRWKAYEDVGEYTAGLDIKAKDANILIGLDGNPIDYGDIYFFDKETGKTYLRRILEYDGDFGYVVEQYEVEPKSGNIYGNSKLFTISNVKSNYDVWKLFGGEWSMELDENRELVPSEDSIIKTVLASCQVGIKKHDGKIKTLNDVHQFMKHSCIHYFATAGAVKQGAANINGKEYYTNGEIPNFQRIKMLQAGILLDKEHSADGEDVSLMTLVISACISRGFTYDKSDKLYKALARIAELGLKENLDAIAAAIGLKNNPKLQELVVDTYLRAIGTDSRPNKAAQVMARELLAAINRGENLPTELKITELPLSDPVIYKQLESKLAIAISKAAIKIKIDGVLSMLCPSHERFKIYGNKLLHEFKRNDISIAQSLLEMLNDYDTSLIHKLTIHDVLMGRTYRITRSDGSTELVKIDTPLDYYNLAEGSSDIVRINEYVINGRNLGHYNCVFTAYTSFGDPKTFNIFDLESVYNLYKAELEHKSSEEITELRGLLLKDLLALKKGEGSIRIHNVADPVDIIRINKVQPYEVILPKYFKTAFGLNQHDNLSEIMEKKEDFFMEKLKEQFSPEIPDTAYDVCLKRADGRHVYIKKRTTPRDANTTEKVVKRSTKNKKPVRISTLGKVIYEFDSKDDKVLQYSYNGNSYEIIETDNIDHYIEQFENSQDIYVSLVNNSYLAELKNKIENEDGDYPKIINNYISEYRESGLSLEDYNKQSATASNLTDKKEQKFRRTAERMFASFQLSLKLIAARIPAQSMLSFMPMVIAGFDNSDTNTAYVSTAQIWLQGSDFDIDTATFTRFSTGEDGNIVHWSSLANLSSYELLEASNELPFPTGLSFVESRYINDLTFIVNNESNPLTFDLLRLGKKKVSLNLSTPQHIKRLAKLIEFVNENGINGLRIKDKDGNLRKLTEQESKHIVKKIRLHNIGLYKKPEEIMMAATKNYMLTLMFDIIANPVNLIQAQTPIDSATKPVKDEADDPTLKDARLSKTSIPGDPTVKIVGIYKNQTGKTGVGICATGLKTYFASFYACTQVLNNSNSTREDLRKVLFGKRGIYIKGKRYFGLANSFTETSTTGEPLEEIELDQAIKISKRLYLEDEILRKIEEALKNKTEVLLTPEESLAYNNKVTEDELRQLIMFSTSKGVDGAVMLSAMLSQATDNAKEGSLGKLNAGMKTLGIYIFGIVLGIPFNELAGIIMSPAGKILSSLTEGNSFSKNMSLDSITEACSYVRYGPIRMLQRLNGVGRYQKEIAEKIFSTLHAGEFTVDGKFDETKMKAAFKIEWEGEKYTDENGKELVRKNSDRKLNVFLVRAFGKFVNPDNDNISDEAKPECGKNHKLTATMIFNLASKLALDPRLVYGENGSSDKKEKREIWKVIADFAQARLTGYADYENFMALSTLSECANEFTTLGQILKLNQGIASNEQDILKTISQFEGVFGNLNVLEDMGELFSLDVFFENPEKWIEYYEKKAKKAINILDVINRTPHFRKYLDALRTYDKNAKTTVKFRTIRTLMPVAAKKLDIRGKQLQKTQSTANKLIDKYLLELWMKDLLLYIIILPGLKYYDLNGALQTAKAPIKIYLSTQENLATFKTWMETVVIPNLKKGYNGLTRGITSLSNNKFIQELRLNSYDNTENHIGMTAYSLPVSMNPLNDYEESIFNQYKSAFNALTVIDGSNETLASYNKYYSGEGNMLSEYNISDLFFLYNLVCFQGLTGQSYLTKIFEDTRDIGLSNDFRRYVNMWDNSGDVLDIPEEYYLYYLTPIGNVFNATTLQVYIKLKDSFERKLYVRKSEAQEEREKREMEEDENNPMNEESGEDETDENGRPIDNSKKNRKGQRYVPSAAGRVINPNFRGFSPKRSSIMINMSSEKLGFENKDVNVIFENGYCTSILYTDENGKFISRYVTPFRMYKNIISSESGYEEVLNSDQAKIMLELILNCKL